MTCVVGVAHTAGVFLGADSAAIDGDDISTGPAKLVNVGPYLIGYCESFRVGQAIAYRLKPSAQKCTDPLEHLATVFVDELRLTLHKAGATATGDPDELPGPLLVAFRGELYGIDSDYAVHPVDDYAAIGAGAPYALGSLHATAKCEPAFRTWEALHAASRHCTAVRQPFHFNTQEP